jgi:hypothetical protein
VRTKPSFVNTVLFICFSIGWLGLAVRIKEETNSLQAIF